MAQFNGKFKLHGTDNLDEFMKELGVTEEMRKIGSKVTPEVTIETTDGTHFKITTVTSYATVVIEFTLGEGFEQTTADGRKTKSVFTIEGGVLRQVEEQLNGGPTATYDRTINTDGDIDMVMSVGSVVAKRLYKKL